MYVDLNEGILVKLVISVEQAGKKAPLESSPTR